MMRVAVKTGRRASASLSVTFVSKRTFLHVFVRTPIVEMLPASYTPKGKTRKDIVDRQEAVQEWALMVDALAHSALATSVHIMQPIRHADAFRVGRMLCPVGDLLLAVPENGRDDRREAVNETTRYIRGVGCPFQIQAQLQDLEYQEEVQKQREVKFSAADVVELPAGNLLALGPRTNDRAHDLLNSVKTRDEMTSIIDTVAVPQSPTAPPLSTYCGYAGDSQLVVWNTADGRRAVRATFEGAGNRPWQPVYLPEGCHFLTYECGIATVSKFDVLVQEGFPEANEILGKNGLHPIPTKWTEMSKLGISMRECVLRLKFARMGSHQDRETERRHSPQAVHGSSNMISRNTNRMPEWAYANTLPDPVFQPPPRYMPPMHKKGPPVVIPGSD